MSNLIIYENLEGTIDIIKEGGSIEGFIIDGISINIYGDSNIVYIKQPNFFRHCKIEIKSSFNYIKIGKSKRLVTFSASIHAGDHQHLCIGDNFSSGGTTFIMIEPCSEIIIGNDCMFSADIVFMNGDAHCILNQDSQVVNWAKGITLYDHIWVGRGARILKNTELQEGSIVAAYSVCSKKFTDKNIAIAGNPAKKIKSDLFWDRKGLYKIDYNDIPAYKKQNIDIMLKYEKDNLKNMSPYINKKIFNVIDAQMINKNK